ncbi:MAG TPA: hypothetical protein VJ648_07105 [Vicinamibacteria bacterium]|nr:hypothetical protein [Vicinamibacteria bacterium]
MAIAHDTSPDADAVQLEAYRRMGGAGRAQVMFRLSEMARRTTEAGVRSRHPEYDAGQVKLALARLLHGDELVRCAWPSRALPEP